MSKEDKSESIRTYVIPDNFIEGGRIFNGMFKLRNFVEAVILGGLAALVALALPIRTFETRISVVVAFAAPWFFLCIIGINDDSFISFIRNAWKWNKNKKTILFDTTLRPREAAAIDMMMADVPVRDQIITKVEELSERRKEAVREYMRNADIEFEEDEELKHLKSPRQREEERLAQIAKQNQAKAKTITETIELDEKDVESSDEFTINIDTDLMVDSDFDADSLY